jgi:hypothetical protein
MNRPVAASAAADAAENAPQATPSHMRRVRSGEVSSASAAGLPGAAARVTGAAIDVVFPATSTAGAAGLGGGAGFAA